MGVKTLCKNPICFNNRVNGKEYCKKHLEEMELKSKVYFKEMCKPKKV